MVSIIKISFIFLWLIQALYQSLVWLYWWQVKEYRLDRFIVFLETKEGRKILSINFILLKLFLFSLLYFGIEIFWLLFLVILIIDLKLIYEFLYRKLRFPVFTERAKKIFATSVFFIAVILFIYLKLNNLYLFIIGEIFIIIAPFFGIAWTIPIVNKIKKEEIQKAKKVLLKFKPIVIGITGSYGKTTTKEFVAKLLSEKYETAKTSGSENTEFGIARKTINFVKRGTKFFVVEMGAYKRGEIRKLADIVEPSVGIITGIEEQHLALFGNLNNIKKAKFELIEHLPDKGTAIFNLTDPNVSELYRWSKSRIKNLKVMGYLLKGKNKLDIKPDLTSEILKVESNKILIEVEFKNHKEKLSIPLIGVHFVENLSAAILVAKLYGLNWNDIQKGCRDLILPEGTMNVVRSKAGSILINDTHNSTPKAFESAIEFLNTFEKQSKIIITCGIIELGEKSFEIHKKLAVMMSNNIDKIFLTNKDFYQAFSEGLGRDATKLYLLKEEKDLEKYLNNKENAILLEGRLPASIMNYIKSYLP